jgi:hypothetical protein
MSRSLDRHFESVGLSLDELHVLVIEGANSHNPVPVADVAVVEDEVAGGGVVADVVDVRIAPSGATPAVVNGRGSFPIFSDSEIAKVKVSGAIDQGGAVDCPELRRHSAVDGDADRWDGSPLVGHRWSPNPDCR